ncbi:unnamed protein product [Amoebophrya sp. A120]|nr:unnamed protein product [Amoebophrya sp. A120]|eukprot:GSA120T00004777001.1
MSHCRRSRNSMVLLQSAPSSTRRSSRAEAGSSILVSNINILLSTVLVLFHEPIPCVSIKKGLSPVAPLEDDGATPVSPAYSTFASVGTPLQGQNRVQIWADASDDEDFFLPVVHRAATASGLSSGKEEAATGSDSDAHRDAVKRVKSGPAAITGRASRRHDGVGKKTAPILNPLLRSQKDKMRREQQAYQKAKGANNSFLKPAPAAPRLTGAEPAWTASDAQLSWDAMWAREEEKEKQKSKPKQVPVKDKTQNVNVAQDNTRAFGASNSWWEQAEWSAPYTSGRYWDEPGAHKSTWKGRKNGKKKNTDKAWDEHDDGEWQGGRTRTSSFANADDLSGQPDQDKLACSSASPATYSDPHLLAAAAAMQPWILQGNSAECSLPNAQAQEVLENSMRIGYAAAALNNAWLPNGWGAPLSAEWNNSCAAFANASSFAASAFQHQSWYDLTATGLGQELQSTFPATCAEEPLEGGTLEDVDMKEELAVAEDASLQKRAAEVANQPDTGDVPAEGSDTGTKKTCNTARPTTSHTHERKEQGPAACGHAVPSHDQLSCLDSRTRAKEMSDPASSHLVMTYDGRELFPMEQSQITNHSGGGTDGVRLRAATPEEVQRQVDQLQQQAKFHEEQSLLCFKYMLENQLRTCNALMQSKKQCRSLLPQQHDINSGSGSGTTEVRNLAGANADRGLISVKTKDDQSLSVFESFEKDWNSWVPVTKSGDAVLNAALLEKQKKWCNTHGWNRSHETDDCRAAHECDGEVPPDGTTRTSTKVGSSSSRCWTKLSKEEIERKAWRPEVQNAESSVLTPKTQHQLLMQLLDEQEKPDAPDAAPPAEDLTPPVADPADRCLMARKDSGLSSELSDSALCFVPGASSASTIFSEPGWSTQAAEQPASTPNLPMNSGSIFHGRGCSPCAWFWKPRSCDFPDSCNYCHRCGEGELKRRKKDKVSLLRASGEIKPQKKKY